jgi:hypothetical protein
MQVVLSLLWLSRTPSLAPSTLYQPRKQCGSVDTAFWGQPGGGLEDGPNIDSRGCVSQGSILPTVTGMGLRFGGEIRVFPSGEVDLAGLGLSIRADAYKPPCLH